MKSSKKGDLPPKKSESLRFLGGSYWGVTEVTEVIEVPGSLRSLRSRKKKMSFAVGEAGK